MAKANETKPIVYYGIYIPGDVPLGVDDDKLELVQTDKAKVILIIKRIKKARFKAFDKLCDAQYFSNYGVELSKPSQSFAEHGHANQSIELADPLVVIEPRPSLRTLKSQDLVQLRKLIENGDYNEFGRMIWENPRYLISTADTPALLHEGCRYNALHYAAKTKNAAVCQIVLEAVSNPKFIQKLYSEVLSQESVQERIYKLRDMYLNMPDKGAHEIPLHFAVKVGAVECVEVLISYPQCERNAKNKFGDTPKDLSSRITSESVRKRILMYLDGDYYVPVLRAENNETQPTIGEAFTPWPKPGDGVPTDPMSADLEIHAFAGPMSKDEAVRFQKKWKTPPRSLANRSGIFSTLDLNKSGQSAANQLVTTPKRSRSFISPHTFRLVDLDKGLECVGRELAHQDKVRWHEFWPFLDTFIDLASVDGLNLFENYLRDRVMENISRVFPISAAVSTFLSTSSSSSLSASNKRSSKFNDISAGKHSGWWRFRNKSNNNASKFDSIDSILNTQYNSYNSKNHSQCLASDRSYYSTSSADVTSSPNNSTLSLSSLCNRFARSCVINDASTSPECAKSTSNTTRHPDVHLDSSLKVYSNRIEKILLDSYANFVNAFHNQTAKNVQEIKFGVSELLMKEIRHINEFVVSHLSDEKYQCCNFQVIHAKITHNVCKKILEMAFFKHELLNVKTDSNTHETALDDNNDNTTPMTNMQQKLAIASKFRNFFKRNHEMDEAKDCNGQHNGNGNDTELDLDNRDVTQQVALDYSKTVLNTLNVFVKIIAGLLAGPCNGSVDNCDAPRAQNTFEHHLNCVISATCVFLRRTIHEMEREKFVTNGMANEFVENLYNRIDTTKAEFAPCACEFRADATDCFTNDARKKRRRTHSFGGEFNAEIGHVLRQNALKKACSSSNLVEYNDVINNNSPQSAVCQVRNENKWRSMAYDSGESSDDEDEDSADELFVTPPTSPRPPRVPKTRRHMVSHEFAVKQFMSFASDCTESDSLSVSSPSSEDETQQYADAQTNDVLDVFIYDSGPTKMDNAAYLAVKDADIHPETHPHVYKWRHHMRMFTDIERSKWRVHKANANRTQAQLETSGPSSFSSPVAATPPTNASLEYLRSDDGALPSPIRSWLRVTGIRAPKRPASATPTSRRLFTN